MDLPVPEGGDVDRGPSALALFWTTTGIAIIMVGLRFAGRRMVRSIGPDDWMMLLTLILYILFVATLTKDILIGGMRHLYYLSPAERINAGKWSWVSQPFVIMGFATGKISVGLMLLRIIGPNTVWRRYLVWFAIGTAFIISCINVVLTYAQCSPVEALWNPALIAMGKAKCLKPSIQTDFAIFLSSWNIVTDTFLAILPITFLYKLNLSLRKKIGLCILLGLGITAAVFAIVKTKYLSSLSARSDITWETYNLMVWSGSELFVIIFCGSVPPIKPIYDRLVGKSNGSSTARATGYGRYDSGNSGKHSKFSGSSGHRASGGPWASHDSDEANLTGDTYSGSSLPLGKISESSHGPFDDQVGLAVPMVETRIESSRGPLDNYSGATLPVVETKIESYGRSHHAM